MAYTSNFLKNVVLRLDFAPLSVLYSDKKPDYSDLIKDTYPLVKGVQFGTVVIAFGGGAGVPAEQPRNGWLWQHSDSEDDNNRRIVTLAPDHFALECVGKGTYTGFAEFRRQFISVYDKFVPAYGVAEYTRIGLRFINEFVIPEEGDALNWEGLLASDLATGVKPGFTNGLRMTRSMHQVSAVKNDVSCLINYGLNNPDFPNPIVRRQFVLDLDSSVSGGIAEAEATRKIDALYDVGRDIFEASIDDGLRKRMEK